MLEALLAAIGDGAIGEERRVAAPTGLEQRMLAAHVEEALELAGEARLRQILGGCAGAHRNRQVGHGAAARELTVGAANRVRHVVRPLARRDQRANSFTRAFERGDASCEGVEALADIGLQAVLLDESPIGRRGGGEAGRHPHPGLAEMTQQLAEGCVLPADALEVGRGEQLERDDVLAGRGDRGGLGTELHGRKSVGRPPCDQQPPGRCRGALSDGSVASPAHPARWGDDDPTAIPSLPLRRFLMPVARRSVVDGGSRREGDE
jgi:hypothetical protein